MNKYFNFFDYETEPNKIIFTPKNIIMDILYDNSNHIIPFSNGKYYYVYQELTFKLIDFLEKDHVSVQIDVSDQLPKIIITNNLKEGKCNELNNVLCNECDELNYVLYESKKFLNDYINKKFSLIM
jgi:hypothetical protein